MELDITQMFNDLGEMPYLSGSQWELGDNAAQLTWNNSKKYAADNPLLKSPEEIQEAKDYFRDYGAWDDEEIASWSDEEVQALMAQEVASQLRDFEMFTNDDGTIDWTGYRKAADDGQIQGSIWQTDDGKIYTYIGM